MEVESMWETKSGSYKRTLSNVPTGREGKREEQGRKIGNINYK